MTATKKRTTTSKSKKKPAAKNVAVRQRSFRPSQDTVPFFTFQISRQTVYWLILCGVVLIFGLWIIHLQIEVERIYDTIELNTFSSNTIPTK